METWSFISWRIYIPIILRFWVNTWCFSHLCVVFAPMLNSSPHELTNDIRVGFEKATRLTCIEIPKKKCHVEIEMLKKRCIEMPKKMWKSVNGNTSVYGQKKFPLEGEHCGPTWGGALWTHIWVLRIII